MEIREQSKIVELWLTREERDDPAFRESLKPIYQQYKDQKYLVAVFLSGEEDLYQQTRDLLLYNRRRLAEKEVQAEKQAGDGDRLVKIRGGGQTASRFFAFPLAISGKFIYNVI